LSRYFLFGKYLKNDIIIANSRFFVKILDEVFGSFSKAHRPGLSEVPPTAGKSCGSLKAAAMRGWDSLKTYNFMEAFSEPVSVNFGRGIFPL